MGRVRESSWLSALAALALATASCGHKDLEGPAPAPSLSPSAAPTPTPAKATTAASLGDAERGQKLVAEFECSRCHDGSGAPEASFEKQCFHCHEKILAGEFEGPKTSMKRWRDLVDGLRDVPTLTTASNRLKRSWITSFLQNPYDVRPRLVATMPRLIITAEQARDIAAYLGAPDDAPDAVALQGDAAHGRTLIEAKGCPSCHAFTGVPKLAGAALIKPNEKGLAPSLTLAPDLRTTRDRLRPDTLVRWIESPKAMKPDTAMPELPLAKEEVRDIAAYILTAELAPLAPRTIPARLPVLTRRVSFDEVSTRVFRRTCWHCHGEPDYAVGDGGPGNTGGFGFKARGLNLIDYGTVASGLIDDQGNRHSIFEPAEGGVSRLVSALLARQEEEASRPRADVRGMPLGFPSLPPEDIQLVESWVAQGRPR